MAASLGRRLYGRLPIPLQNVACTVEGARLRRLRFGGSFQRRLAWLRETERWSAERARAHQDEAVRDLVRRAAGRVPYYRDLFRRAGVDLGAVRGVDDLGGLPLLTKEDVREHREALVAEDADRRSLVEVRTSGTTGKSLRFWQEPEAIRFRWAVWWRHRERYGARFGERHATFTGYSLVDPGRDRPPYWRENRALAQTLFPMHHVTRDKVPAIVDRLDRGGYAYLSGYPSILAVLAGEMLELGRTLATPPRAVFTGAETLHEHQRAAMEAAFGCPVTDQYGFSEGCGNASRCPEGDVFHEDVEFGVLECLDPEPLPGGRVRGRIVATGFADKAMPFLRYEVGDVGVWREGPCVCGRATPVLERIEGRVEDYVTTPEGARVLRFDYVFKDAESVVEAQVVQRRLGEVVLRVVRRPGYGEPDEAHLREAVHSKVSPRLDVAFEYVDRLEREPGGKVRAVKSLLPR
ncbi:MAG: phenylacetate--CoA ligase family protein [Gemmatimonadetes bacterium]|nr:phenylacetate--CoA ligase family protein [Gemmatimonadota bacterium]